MSVFHCDGCDKYLDSDESGYHEINVGQYYCDDCESCFHECDFRESMNQLRMNLGMGEI